MKILRPVEMVLGGTVVSTTATDPTPEWVSGTVYAVGDLRKRASVHRVFKRTTAGGGVVPPELDATNWVDYLPTNDWGQFDGENNTRTVATGALSFVLSPGLVNSLYLGGLDATALTAVFRDAPGGVVMATYTDDLEGSIRWNWYDYLFADFRPLSDILFENVPMSPTAEIAITMTSAATVACGVTCVGKMRDIGRTQYKARAKLKSYSFIDTDEFGNTRLIKRHTVKTITATALIDAGDASLAQSLLDEIDGIPVLCIAARGDDFEPLRAFGRVTGEISYESFAHRLLSYSAEGLI